MTTALAKWVCVLVFIAPSGQAVQFVVPITGATTNRGCLREAHRLATTYPSAGAPEGLHWEWLAACYRDDDPIVQQVSR